ncbi:hypothetical protein [Actinoallomurus sp. CA-150999]|uniref:hypothetical protein n=1 Tax=Actinoallomurus sp. CA-150999 TaxID=3239887 RepID=UPI003D947582
MPRRTLVATLALLPAAAMLLVACSGDKKTPSRATTSAKATPTTALPASSSPPAPQPPSISTAADGRKLSACKDGECEVVVEKGDVIRFGNAVKTKPKVDGLTVVDVGEEGPVLALSSGMTTTVNGGIEINGGLSIEAGVPEHHRVAIRISRIR